MASANALYSPPRKKRRTCQSHSSSKRVLCETLLQMFDDIVTQKRGTRFAKPVVSSLEQKLFNLNTIRTRLVFGHYTDPWLFIADMRDEFRRILLGNRKNTLIHKLVIKLSPKFDRTIDGVVRSLGYCCGQNYWFHPRTLSCFGSEDCTIARYAKYYYHPSGVQLCTKCYFEIGPKGKEFTDVTETNITLEKADLEEKKNDECEQERFVTCVSCEKTWHQVCALWLESIWPDGWICDACREIQGIKVKENTFTAKSLPTTNLSVHLEKRVNKFLQKFDSSFGDIIIRVVSNCQKEAKVSSIVKERFGKELPDCFPYKTKAIFVFQSLDGYDVCFFGMHVQEYGSDCPHPNTRKVYLAYLDSVYYFRPKQLRTAVYHQILLGYLDYARQMGFETAHLWACPPKKGTDFIFNCHPPEQKTATSKRLEQWYTVMLDIALGENIALNYTNMFQYCQDNDINTLKDMPYFDGDFWPNFYGETLKELNENIDKLGSKGMNVEETNEFLDDNTKVLTEFHARIHFQLSHSKERFFVIRLIDSTTVKSLGPTIDLDPLTTDHRMSGRNIFFEIANQNSYEFSSLRRAKLATMAFLYELHSNLSTDLSDIGRRALRKRPCNTRLSLGCHSSSQSYPMSSTSIPDVMETLMPAVGYSPLTLQKECFERLNFHLIHSSQCTDTLCLIKLCKTMKQITNHVLDCSQKTSLRCEFCHQFEKLCKFHVKNCYNRKCTVKSCQQMKKNGNYFNTLSHENEQRILRNRSVIIKPGIF